MGIMLPLYCKDDNIQHIKCLVELMVIFIDTGLQTSAYGGVAWTSSRYDPKILAFSIHGDLA